MPWAEAETGNLSFVDPDGNALMLHHRYAPVSTRA